MSAEQTRKSITQLDKEITALGKKSAEYAKKESASKSSAARVTKSITKNTSLATRKSKLSQIKRHESDTVKAASAQADVDKKIADKQKKRSDAQAKLQREEATERKKSDKSQASLKRGYEQRIGELTEQLNAQVIIPTARHLYSEDNEEEYDVFISHASEDKVDFADGLYQELEARGVKVWYDTINIAWGDSLRKEIDNELRKSKFGIVILSNDYIRKGWTQYELDGLFQREMTGGKTILPIWHKITKDEVQAFSPTLAGRKALNTAMLSAVEIAEELIRLLPMVKFDDSMENEEDTTHG